MKHPTLALLKPIPSSIAAALMIVIPDDRLRYGVAALLTLYFLYILWQTKKPSRKMRERLMVYYASRAISMCETEQQADNLLSFIQMQIDES